MKHLLSNPLKYLDLYLFHGINQSKLRITHPYFECTSYQLSVHNFFLSCPFFKIEILIKQKHPNYLQFTIYLQLNQMKSVDFQKL